MNRNDPEIYGQQIRRLYHNMLLLISVVVLGVVGVLLYTWIGNPFKGSFESKGQIVASQKKNKAKNDDADEVVNGVHVMTGLKAAKGFELVRGNCTACHSAKLITQNRATREGWEEMIDWMQATQGLWELGGQESTILDYLAKNYGPEEIGRRANLKEIEWYVLE